MRPLRLLALCLCAALVGCSDADDLGRVLDDGSIQGQRLDQVHDHGECSEDHDHGQDGDCDGAHAHDAGCEEDHAAGEDCEDHGATDPPAASAQPPAVASVDPASPPAPPAASVAPAAPAPTVTATPTPATPSSPTPSPAAARGSGRFDRSSYTWIDFDPLMDFEYPELVRLDGDVPPPELPAAVRALNGKRVAVEGFMSPLAFDAGGVKEFSLVQDPSLCCFGAVPEMNHWIHVVMPDKERTEFYSFDPVAVFGVLQVGEEYQDGYVVSLYRMVADRVEGDF